MHEVGCGRSAYYKWRMGGLSLAVVHFCSMRELQHSCPACLLMMCQAQGVGGLDAAKGKDYNITIY